MLFVSDLDGFSLVAKLTLLALCTALSTVVWLQLHQCYLNAEFTIEQ